VTIEHCILKRVVEDHLIAHVSAGSRDIENTEGVCLLFLELFLYLLVVFLAFMLRKTTLPYESPDNGYLGVIYIVDFIPGSAIGIL
jgi:hypothetical protein